MYGEIIPLPQAICKGTKGSPLLVATLSGHRAANKTSAEDPLGRGCHQNAHLDRRRTHSEDSEERLVTLGASRERTQTFQVGGMPRTMGQGDDDVGLCSRLPSFGLTRSGSS
jgi:hypothetical protein